MMLDVYGATLIVCKGQTLDENADAEEQQMYRAVHAQARLLIVNSTEKEIQLTIIKKRSCYEIWNHLKAAYYRDTPIDAIGQMRTVFSTVGDNYDATQPIGDFITHFET